MRAETPRGKRADFEGRKLDANESCDNEQRNERYYSWAELTRRAIAIDVLECAHCQPPIKILAQTHPPDTTRQILRCLGLLARPPPIIVARVDPQDSLPIDSDEAAPLD